MNESEAAPTTGYRNKIVEKAKELAILHRDSSYKLGGKCTSGFDCSYFVYLVMNEVFPNYAYIDSTAIASSPLFRKASTGRPGDIILFPAGQVPYAVKKGDKKEYPSHVGVVLDSMSWVGRQTSSLGVVLFSNPWWRSRSVEYYTYQKIDAAPAHASGFSLRGHLV